MSPDCIELSESVDRDLTGREGRSRVVVVDDHALFAESLVLTLRAVGIDANQVDHGSEDLVRRIQSHAPNLVLMDLFLGDESSPSLFATRLLASVGIPVLIVTATSDRLLHAECVDNGASAVVEKSSHLETLIETVQRMLRSEVVMSVSFRTRLLNELEESRRSMRTLSQVVLLTQREREVLHALTLGHPAAWIAQEHRTSLVTVRTHIRSILAKLNIHSQLEAVTLAMREGWFNE